MEESTSSSGPQCLGDFQIIRELGRGGMGVVYEAQQKSLHRRVALKVLSSGLRLSSKAVRRFRREAEAAGKLHHTNIVPIYTTGEDRGIHFYAMEFVDGPSLDTVIRELRKEHGSGDPDDSPGKAGTQSSARESQGDEASATSLPAWVRETALYSKRDVRDRVNQGNSETGHRQAASQIGSSSSSRASYFDTVATMIADVADALDHAHEHGVIHRDVKPSNLLLAPDGRLRVNDFGLARMLEQPGMTISGEFVGSPLYMSPEQITAGRAPLDHRTDIYSLGATLYELLTHKPPFPGASRDQVIAGIMHKDPVAPRRIKRGIPIDLETICLKAISRDPDRRYQTAGQLASDLRRFVNRYAISARRLSLVEKTIRYLRRTPYATALLLLLFATLTIASIAAWRVHEDRKRQELRGVQDGLFMALLRGDYDDASELLNRGEKLSPSPAWVEFSRGQISLYRGEYESAKMCFERALEDEPDDVSAKALRSMAYLWGGDEASYFEQIAQID